MSNDNLLVTSSTGNSQPAPDSLQLSGLSSTITDGLTISASEMEELFGCWTANGKCDLQVNTKLAEKIHSYLEWQKKVKPLKVALANDQFENFLVPKEFLKENVFIDTYVNGEFLGSFCFYGMSSYFCILKFADFRWILNYIGNELVNYAYRDAEVYIDVASWILSRKGQIKPKDGKWYITLN